MAGGKQLVCQVVQVMKTYSCNVCHYTYYFYVLGDRKFLLGAIEKKSCVLGLLEEKLE